METIVANAAGKARRVLKDGREYLVCPATFIVPGVLHGTEGPIFYPPEVVAADPSKWDGTPIVLGHPLKNGRGVPVREGDYLERNGVGHVANGHADARSRLRADAWFDVERLGRVEPTILADLTLGNPVALSTSMAMPVSDAPPGSVYGGRPYTKVAGDAMKPDHVGVFRSGQRTACSIADGCGVLVGNALSHEALRDRLQALLDERFPPPAVPYEDAVAGRVSYHAAPWITAVYDKYLVYCQDGDHYRLGYQTDLRSDAVSLSDEPPVEVTLTTAYKPVANQSKEQPMPLTPDQRREITSRLVANCNCQPGLPWYGATEGSLARLSDDALDAYGRWQQSLTANAPAPAPQPRQEMLFRLDPATGHFVPVQAQAPAPAAQAEPVANATPPAQPAPRVRTAEEWAAETFPGLSLAEIDGAIRHNLDLQRQHKAGLIDRLTMNAAVGEERDSLARDYDLLPVASLERLVANQEQQRPRVQNNYTGVAGVPPGGRASAPPALSPTGHNHKPTPTYR